MGVTIHFEGKLKGTESLEAVLASAERFSYDRRWGCKSIDDVRVTLKRVRDEKDWDYDGPVSGIELQPHENSEPFRLEFDRDLYLQEYCKTQFAPIEVHIQIVGLLHLLRPLFESLEVYDEGEYYETGDLTLLTNHRNRCSNVINEYLERSDKNSGPVRLESGRIVDIVLCQE